MLASEDVAGSPYVQVAHGDLEATAQFRKLLDGFQALAGIHGERAQRGCKKIAECFFVAAAHPPAKLVQVAQPELMCIVDDDRVGIGNVQAGFDDIGAHENIVFVGYEIEHMFFEFLPLHLPVGHPDADIRTEL